MRARIRHPNRRVLGQAAHEDRRDKLGIFGSIGVCGPAPMFLLSALGVAVRWRTLLYRDNTGGFLGGLSSQASADCRDVAGVLTLESPRLARSSPL
jgi:hypothetical protein